MYMNPTIKKLFKYAKAYEKMYRGNNSVSKRKMAYEFVSLVCLSRIDLVFLLDEHTLSKLTRLEQFKLMKLLCDIYGEPSNWKDYEGKPTPSKALLTLEKEYLEAFKASNFYNFSFAFRDFHDHLHPTDQERVDEEIIMLGDRPIRKPTFKLRLKWFFERNIDGIRRLLGKSDFDDIPF